MNGRLRVWDGGALAGGTPNGRAGLQWRSVVGFEFLACWFAGCFIGFQVEISDYARRFGGVAVVVLVVEVSWWDCGLLL